MLVANTAWLSRQRAPDDVVRLAVGGRRLLEDQARLLQQRIAPLRDRRHVEQIVVDLREKRAVLLTEQPQTRRGRTVRVDPRLGIERDVQGAGDESER